jgi:hypothetical protein
MRSQHEVRQLAERHVARLQVQLAARLPATQARGLPLERRLVAGLEQSAVAAQGGKRSNNRLKLKRRMPPVKKPTSEH